MRDVAERAGVSVTTVSHVINETRVVSDDSRDRVLEAMSELGYQPNALARSLRRKETYTLGVIVPDSADPFFAEVVRGIEDTSFQQGYTITLCNSDHDLDKELLYTNALREKQVDGILFFSAGGKSAEHIQRLQKRRMPLVVVDRHTLNMGLDSVLIDNDWGGWCATRHLVRLGHRRIACITGPSDLTLSAERVTGYRRALAEGRLPVDEKLILKGDFQFESGYQAARQLLAMDVPPTAIFACNDLMAVGVVNAVQELGYKVPENLSVVGFDDVRLASFINPPLTTIAQPKYEMGHIATTMLLERIDNPDMSSRQRMLDTELVVRRSTAPLQASQ
jgi:LacI family transcriptional regulator